MENFNPYDVLGVPIDADDRTVKRAYRNKAKKLHPDAGGDRDAFERTVKALAVLTDPLRREKFDRTGRIDDEQADLGPDHGALTMLGNMLSQMLAGDEDPLQHDLVAVMREILTKEEHKERDGLTKMDRAVERIHKIKKRFKGKSAGKFVAMLDWQIMQIEFTKKRQEQIKKDRARALEILADAEFKPNSISTFFFAGAGTSASTM